MGKRNRAQFLTYLLMTTALIALIGCNFRNTPEDPAPQDEQEQTNQEQVDNQSENQNADSNQAVDDGSASEQQDEVEEPEPAENQEDSSDQTDQTDQTDQPVEDTSNAADDNMSDDSAAETVDPSIRVQFDPGTTGTIINGEIEAGQINSYVLQVAERQIMAIRFNGPDTAGFGVSDSAGSLFESETSLKTFTSEVPTSGDLTISVGSQTSGSYELTVTVIDTNQFGSQALPSGERVLTTLNPLGDVLLLFKGTADVGDLPQVNGVDIYGLFNGELHQTLNFQSETPVPVQPPSLIVEDVNFDGYTDLGIPLFTTAGTNLPLSYFLWDPTVNQFIRNENFDVLMGPTILDGKRILTRARAGAGDVYYEVFRIGKSGPISVARQSCEVKPDDSGEIVIQNIGVTIDNAGLETQVFNELSTEECLPFKVAP